jgi:hypothetical protein
MEMQVHAGGWFNMREGRQHLSEQIYIKPIDAFTIISRIILPIPSQKRKNASTAWKGERTTIYLYHELGVDMKTGRRWCCTLCGKTGQYPTNCSTKYIAKHVIECKEIDYMSTK